MRHFPTQTMRQMHFALKKESSISFSVQFSLPWPTTIFAFLLMNAIEHKTPKVIQRGLSHAMITGPRTVDTLGFSLREIICKWASAPGAQRCTHARACRPSIAGTRTIDAAAPCARRGFYLEGYTTARADLRNQLSTVGGITCLRTIDATTPGKHRWFDRKGLLALCTDTGNALSFAGSATSHRAKGPPMGLILPLLRWFTFKRCPTVLTDKREAWHGLWPIRWIDVHDRTQHFDQLPLTLLHRLQFAWVPGNPTTLHGAQQVFVVMFRPSATDIDRTADIQHIPITVTTNIDGTYAGQCRSICEGDRRPGRKDSKHDTLSQVRVLRQWHGNPLSRAFALQSLAA